MVVNAFIQELFHSGIYKRTQGRITRQVTWAAMAVVLALGVWRLGQTVISVLPTGARFGLCGAVFVGGLWIAYRIVNVPVFADFLIAVEAEMNKVSWPTRGELFRASLVVLIVIIALTSVLFAFDAGWAVVFKWLGIL